MSTTCSACSPAVLRLNVDLWGTSVRGQSDEPPRSSLQHGTAFPVDSSTPKRTRSLRTTSHGRIRRSHVPPCMETRSAWPAGHESAKRTGMKPAVLGTLAGVLVAAVPVQASQDNRMPWSTVVYGLQVRPLLIALSVDGSAFLAGYGSGGSCSVRSPRARPQRRRPSACGPHAGAAGIGGSPAVGD